MRLKKIILSRYILLSVTFYTPVYAAELSLPQFPLQITEYVEPNVMLLLDTSGSMGFDVNGNSNPAAGDSRMDIMKAIATELVTENKNIRFCLARFRYDQGAKILSECGSSNEDITEITTQIAGLTAGGSTPLAEAYYEVITYFAGKTPKYVNGGSGFSGDHSNNDRTLINDVTLGNGKYRSPIQYRCQKNYTIVLTDGTPQLDSFFPDFPADKENIYGSPAPITDYNIHSNLSEISGPDGNYDGVNNDGDGGNPYDNATLGVYYFLDDMAKYAWDIDLRNSIDSDVADDLTGESFGSPSDSDEFSQQNLSTFTVGFTLDIDMLSHAADYGQGGDGTDDASDHYYTAANEEELSAAFEDAINDIVTENLSTAEPTTNSDLFSADLRLFQTRFVNNQWTGELIAYQIEDVTYNLVEEWVAPASFPSNWENRVVDSAINGGVPLKWEQLSTTQKTDWFADTSNRLNYIRGKTATEIGGSSYRARESLMGDIVNSSPLYVGPPESGKYDYTDIETSYQSFVATHNASGSERETMIYVGANDGMLHGFDSLGQEKMAFVPSKAMPNLAELSQTDYSHLFYVDGAPVAADVYGQFSTGAKSWKTILVGGLRRGGQAIYAIDITDPSRFENGDDSADETRAGETFLWEFSDDETSAASSSTDKYTGDKDLGYSYAQPQLMRLNDGEFYVAVGSGYNSTESDGHTSTTGDAVLFLLNVVTGEVVKKISTGYGMAEDPASGSLGNGLATVSGFDAGTLDLSDGEIKGSGDGKIDYIYAGDLFGNVWKFDLSSATPSDWDYVAETNPDDSLNSDRNPLKLFTAKDADDVVQPITVQLQVHQLYDGEVMLFFGTGKLLEETDTQAVNVAKHSFYGIVDTNAELAGRSVLLEQQITYQELIVSQEQRIVTDYIRDDSQKGWYLDLQKPQYDTSNQLSYLQEGEQVIVTARILDNVVYFVTNFSDQDACLPPVKKNFLMTLGVRSGASLEHIIIDTDGDGVIDFNDNANFGDNPTSNAVSGRTGYGSQLPVIVKTDSEGAGLICDGTDCDKMQAPDKEWRRTSWREIKTN